MARDATSVRDVQRCFHSRSIASHVHGGPFDNASLQFAMQTRMRGVGDGAGWHEDAVLASFEFRMPQLHGVRVRTRRGLYLDRSVLQRALAGKQPEASYLKMRLSTSGKRVVANARDLQQLQQLLPSSLPANALQPTESLHDSCAVVGSSAKLLACKFGKEIDGHEAVFRINDAPTKHYQRWVGAKTTYRLLNDVSRRGVDNATMLIPMRILHDDVKSMRKEGRKIWFVFRTPQPYWNNHRTFLYNGTKLPLHPRSSGFVALRIAMDLCNRTTAYGFTTEEESTYGRYHNKIGHKSGPEFFKDKGHELLGNRAHFLFFNCTGMARFPMC